MECFWRALSAKGPNHDLFAGPFQEPFSIKHRTNGIQKIHPKNDAEKVSKIDAKKLQNYAKIDAKVTDV